jgi:hypothetical protein
MPAMTRLLCLLLCGCATVAKPVDEDWLSSNGQRVSEVVAQFNRANPTYQIVIDNPELGARYLGGRLLIHQPEDLVRALLGTGWGATMTQSVTQEGGQVIHLE